MTKEEKEKTVKEKLIEGIYILQIPSLLLYVLFLVVLIRYRKTFRSSFYRITIGLGVSDIAYGFVTSSHKLIVSYTEISKHSDFVRKLYLYGALCFWNGSYLGQLTGVLILSVNRFSAVMFPMKYEKLWSGKLPLTLGLCAQWVPTLVYTVVQLATPMVKNNQSSLGYRMSPEALVVFHAGFAAYLTAICACILVLYTAMFVRLLLHRRRTLARINTETTAGGAGRNQEKSRERKMALVGLVLGASVIYFTFSNLTGYLEHAEWTPQWLKARIAGIGGRQFLTNYVSPVVDFIFTFSNPYLILATSSQCRQCMWKFFGRATARLSGTLVKTAAIKSKTSRPQTQNVTKA